MALYFITCYFSFIVPVRYPESLVLNFIGVRRKFCKLALRQHSLLLSVLNCHVALLQILGYFDYAFTAIFTVEILLKVNASPCLEVFYYLSIVNVMTLASTGPRLCRLCLH